jgi:acetolactate synthase I/II/III large subunit
LNTATVPAYEALARDIKSLGTEVVFGLMSDDTALLVATLDTVGVRFVGARHENNAISMAEGYAVATDRLGIAILGRGPATANGLHGAVFAQRSGSRVLLMFGAESLAPDPGNGLGPNTKALNTAGVLEAAGIPTYVPTDARSVRQVLETAVAATQSGAVAMLLPMNVQFGQVPVVDTVVVAPPPAAAPARRPARKAAINAAAALLRESCKPLFVAGRGAHRAGARDALIRLADKLGAGLATTLKAKDMFRGHPLDLGMVGSFSHAGGRRVIDQADCVVVFGAGLNLRTTSYGTSLPVDVPLIQVDRLRTNIGRWYHADVAVVADARSAAEQLLEALPERAAADKPLHSVELRRWLADFDLASEFQPAHTARTMDARALALELDRLLPQHRNICYDAGNFLQIVPFLSVPGPDHIKMASDFSSIGMGFGSAMGFALGRPDEVTAFFVGDGSFLMTLGELETVAREDIPLVIILMNDCAYGAELHYLKERNMPVAKSVFPDIDYAPVAEAFGFQAATVRTLDELRALAPMLAKPDRATFLDCKINASVAAPFLLEGIEHERRKGSN